MFVEPDRSLELSKKVLASEPTGRLLWYTIPWYLTEPAAEAGYDDPMDFMMRELGALSFENLVGPFELANDSVEIVDTPDGVDTIREYRSPWGTLRAVMRGGRFVRHPVTDADALRTLIEMWKRIEVRVHSERFAQMVQRINGRGPVGISIPTSSLQQMVQHELGVADLWYAMADTPELVEEAMEVYQAKLQTAYDALGLFDADWYYQGENTSTTAISPDYYRKYSLGHIRQYTQAVRALDNGKPAVVHMCGLLHDLMPIFPETRLDGIDCLTPPPVGDCDFQYAYEVMPEGFFCTGRLNSTLWVGKRRDEILANLRSILPHSIYRDKPFVMIVTTDTVPNISVDNWRLLADCINAYEQV